MSIPEGDAPGSWVAAAACAGKPLDWFFPAPGAGTNLAKEVCARCPVRNDCRSWSRDRLWLQGVWASTSPGDRSKGVEPTQEVPVDVSSRRPANRPGELERHLDRLFEHPGRWAVVARYQSESSASSVALRLKRSGRWPTVELVGRKAHEGSELFARHTGLTVVIDASPAAASEPTAAA